MCYIDHSNTMRTCVQAANITTLGKRWAERPVTRSKELKMAFNWTKDYQRKLQEDPEVIKAWFKLVKNTKAKYGIYDDDVHNFDETGSNGCCFFLEGRY